MADLRSRDTPLLGNYKLQYVLSILPQTLLGGIKLRFNFSVPLSIYLLQTLIWLLPFLICGVWIVIAETTTLDNDLCGLICGVFTLCLYLILNFVVIWFKRHAKTAKVVKNNFFTEEDEIDFSLLFSLTTLEFLFPRKKFYANYVFHPLLLGLVTAFGLLFLLPTNLKRLFDDADGCYVYSVLGLFVLCTLCYPLIGQTPKELAVYYDLSNYDLSQLTRPIYGLMFFIWDFVTRNDTNFDGVNYTLHLLFVVLPFLFIFGLLPPYDALLLWGMEYTQGFVLGGSPMATDLRLLLITLLSWTTICISHFIPDQTLTIIFTAVSTVLISTDFTSVLNWCLTSVRISPQKVKETDVTMMDLDVERNWFYYLKHHSKHILKIIFMLISVGIISGLVKFKIQTLHNEDVINFSGYVHILLCCVHVVLADLRNVSCVFGILRNPFYSTLKSRRYGMVFYLIHTIGIPLYVVYLTSVLLVPRNLPSMEFYHTMLLYRAYNQIWHDTLKSSLDILLLLILRWSNFNPSYWSELQLVLQLFLISIISHYIIQLLRKCWFIILLIYGSITGQKDQKRKVYTSIGLTFGLLPVTLLTVLLSTVLNAPLLPIFTLPLFIVGFPRPTKFWPHVNKASKSSSPDWIYYDQILSSIVENIRNSSVFTTYSQPGEHYLARFQDRIIWISILENGLFYKRYVIKGLELQETSCHTEEAQFLDDLLDLTFNNKTKIFNTQLLSAIQAKCTLDIRGYSDARNVLTGIIDSHGYLENYSMQFPKVLGWVLLRYCLHNNGSNAVVCLCNGNNKGDAEASRVYPSHLLSLDVAKATSNDNDCEEITLKTLNVPSYNDQSTLNKRHIPKQHTEATQQKWNEENESDDDEFGNFGFDEDDNDDENDDVTPFDSNDVIHNNGEHSNDLHDVETFQLFGNSLAFDVPSCWKQAIPFTENDLICHHTAFPNDWFLHVLNSLEMPNSPEFIEDHMLYRLYRLLVLNCHYLINILSINDNSIVEEGPGHVFRVFNGQLPWSPNLSWIEGHDVLKDLVVKASRECHIYDVDDCRLPNANSKKLRYTFQLAYEMEILGVENGHTEILSTLNNYEENWYIGDETSKEWSSAVLKNIPNLLSLGLDKKMNVYTSRMLSIQDIQVPVVKLNEECVQGLWSSLCLELYYMTNDDEERYSIQALPSILRNIIIQAADPPLGYPVYTSGLITIRK